MISEAKQRSQTLHDRATLSCTLWLGFRVKLPEAKWKILTMMTTMATDGNDGHMMMERDVKIEAISLINEHGTWEWKMPCSKKCNKHNTSTILW